MTSGEEVRMADIERQSSQLNKSSEDEMEIWGYRTNRMKHMLCWCAFVLSLGLVRLVFYWKPHWHLLATSDRCSLSRATKVLVKDVYQQLYVEEVCTDSEASVHLKGDSEVDHVIFNQNHTSVQLVEKRDVRYFMNKRVRYVWTKDEVFQPVRGLDDEISCCSYFHLCEGLSSENQQLRRRLYGPNSIAVHVTPIRVLLFTQALNPFYFFQLFSVCVWYTDQYVWYASCIVLMSVISLCTQIYQTRKMQRALKNTISGSSIVSVCRGSSDGKEVYEDIHSDDLVPGDVIEVPRSGCNMTCDAVLITGNCIVNESMLTGESVPVTKTPLPHPSGVLPFCLKEHAKHILFCGTHVIQTRFYRDHKVKAVVIRTGFATAKGELVRAILFPKPGDFKFSQDAFKFIGVLFVVAMAGMIYSVVLRIQQGLSVKVIIVRSLDLITIVVPPALPAAMTIGIVFAQQRLKHKNIFCISPNNINQCGALNVVCFDKTGTLTEDGLDMLGVVPSRSSDDPVTFGDLMEQAEGLTDHVTVCMATCHSLTQIEGHLTGDPLDLKMFNFTQWELDEPGEDAARFDMFAPTVVRPRTAGSSDIQSYDNDIGIVRQLTFTSKLQRMSVITRRLEHRNFELYVKGAPETIASLCKAETLPRDFHEKLQEYTQLGYRVLALAWRPLSAKLTYVRVQREQREKLEMNLRFLGLLVLENRLKPESTENILELKRANIRPIMVTGDNMLTALSVARDCQLLDSSDRTVLVQVTPPTGQTKAQVTFTRADCVGHQAMGDQVQQAATLLATGQPSTRVHFALTGRTWAMLRDYLPDMLEPIVLWGTVFARMSPDQKQQLVETLQQLGYYVGMCGDGANDCGALKTAHAGISLSEAEASVASPFTSKEPNISCVPKLIKEGRAALVTSSGIFKYMASYSLNQFISVCLLYWVGATMTDFTFMYVDIVLVVTLSMTFSRTEAYPKLYPSAPRVSLLSVVPLTSFALQMLLSFSVQTVVFLVVREQPWFEPFVPNEEEDYQCHVVTTMFYISSFQYIIMAVAYSRGVPYRKPIYTNYLFLLNVLLTWCLTMLIVVKPFGVFVYILQLRVPPSIAFRGLLVAIAFGQLIAALIAEMLVIDFDVFWRCGSSAPKRPANLPYIQLEDRLTSQGDWPPISPSHGTLADMMRAENEIAVPTVELHKQNGSVSGSEYTLRRHLSSETSYENVAFTDTEPMLGCEQPQDVVLDSIQEFPG